MSDGRWKKGQSGNPKGVSSEEMMAKRKLRKILGEKGPELLDKLIALTDDPDPKVRLQALTYCITQVMGKPPQMDEQPQEGKPTVLVLDGYEIKPREAPPPRQGEARE